MTLPSLVFTLVLALSRVSAFVTVFPLFAGRNLPNTVKIGLSVVLTFIWFTSGIPSTGVTPGPDGSWGSMLVWSVAAVRETCLGAALAFAMGLFLLPLQVAGTFIGQEMGLSMASQADPTSQGAASVVSQFFLTIGMLMFFTFDLHHSLLRALHVSFFTRPIGQPFEFPSVATLFSGLADAHEAGLLLSAPIVGALFIALIALLVTARSAPQLNMFSVGFPFRLVVGLIAAFVFFPEMCVLGLRAMSRMTNVASW
ncbi:MAG: flagellar biosynthetic protein FliR [Planctomycetaceae bacterium]